MTKAGTGKKNAAQQRGDALQTREQRLKQALRANLRRRKAQKRGRAQSASEGGKEGQ